MNFQSKTKELQFLIQAPIQTTCRLPYSLTAFGNYETAPQYYLDYSKAGYPMPIWCKNLPSPLVEKLQIKLIEINYKLTTNTN